MDQFPLAACEEQLLVLKESVRKTWCPPASHVERDFFPGVD